MILLSAPAMCELGRKVLREQRTSQELVFAHELHCPDCLLVRFDLDLDLEVLPNEHRSRVSNLSKNAHAFNAYLSHDPVAIKPPWLTCMQHKFSLCSTSKWVGSGLSDGVGASIEGRGYVESTPVALPTRR